MLTIIDIYCSGSLTAKWQTFFLYYLEYFYKEKLFGYHEVQLMGKEREIFFSLKCI